MISILHAWLLAVPIGLNSCFVDCCLVGRCTLNQFDRLFERGLLCCTVLLAEVEVLCDEVTSWLDLLEVSFDCLFVFSCRLQVLLCSQLVLLCLRKLLLQACKILFSLLLLLLQLGHAIFVVSLGFL